MEGEDEAGITIRQVHAVAQGQLTYEYDFGDGWKHEVRLQQVFAAKAGVEYPVCVAGESAAPPDDCGGTGGYWRLLQALGDPTHEGHTRATEWLGPSFDPTAFDFDAVNADLARWHAAQARPRRRKKGCS